MFKVNCCVVAPKTIDGGTAIVAVVVSKRNDVATRIVVGGGDDETGYETWNEIDVSLVSW